MSAKETSLYYGRFKELPWFDTMSSSTILVGGAGGIGSHLTFMLARAGASVLLFDYDKVEEHNIAGQLFGREDIGKSKVQAVSDVVNRLCGENKVNPVNMKVEESNPQWKMLMKYCKVVCAVFDNIHSRKLLYNEWKKNVEEDPEEFTLFIDGRMAAENGQVFAVCNTSSKGVIEKYESNFFDDSEVEDLPCSARATTHCGSFISTLIMFQITNWMNNNNHTGALIAARNVANSIEFHMPVMYLNFILNRPVSISHEMEVEPSTVTV